MAKIIQKLRPIYAIGMRKVLPPAIKTYNALPIGNPIRLTNPRIHHGYKFIYIHIPKTAGTSITNAIHALPSKSADHKQREVEFKYAKHIRGAEMRDAIGQEIWNDYFTFAFARNPWDLMVSSYNWWLQIAKQHKVREHQAEFVQEMADFDEYIRYVTQPGPNRIWQNNIYDFISDKDELIVDFVGKFENLHADWEKICQFGNLPHTPLPHLNASKRKHYSAYFTPETRNLVHQKYARSIEALGYEFEKA